MPANRATNAHREPIRNTIAVIRVSARPNASCIGCDIILADCALTFCGRRCECLCGVLNLSLIGCYRNRVKEVREWEGHDDRRRLRSPNGLLMNSVGQF